MNNGKLTSKFQTMEIEPVISGLQEVTGPNNDSTSHI